MSDEQKPPGGDGPPPQVDPARIAAMAVLAHQVSSLSKSPEQLYAILEQVGGPAMATWWLEHPDRFAPGQNIATQETIGLAVAAPVPFVTSPGAAAQAANKRVYTSVDRRRFAGYGTAAVACVLIVIFLLVSLLHFPKLFDAKDVANMTQLQIIAWLSSIVAHALITFAGVYFCYALLRAAERMILPESWAIEPEVAAVMLGLRHPTAEVRKQVTMLTNLLLRKSGD